MEEPRFLPDVGVTSPGPVAVRSELTRVLCGQIRAHSAYFMASAFGLWGRPSPRFPEEVSLRGATPLSPPLPGKHRLGAWRGAS